MILSTFPGITREWLFSKCSIQEFFLWWDRAQELKTGKLIERDRTKLEDINSRFTWNEKAGRWE